MPPTTARRARYQATRLGVVDLMDQTRRNRRCGRLCGLACCVSDLSREETATPNPPASRGCLNRTGRRL